MPGVNRQAFQKIRGLDYTRVSLIPSSPSRTEIIRKVFVDQMVRIHQDQERSTEMSLSCHSQRLPPVIPDVRNRESIRHFLKHRQPLFTPPIVNGMMSLYTLMLR